MKLGIDLDGVLCDFNTAFLHLLHEITPGVTPGWESPSRHRPTTWDWPRAYGYDKRTIDLAWHHVAAPSTRFWERLDPEHDPLLTRRIVQDLDAHPEVYYITSRPGTTARQQSIDWLQRHGARKPTVLMSSDKGILARALQLDVVLDDHVGNVADVLAQSNARAALFEREYSTHWGMAVDPKQRHRLELVEPTVDGLQVWLQQQGLTGSAPTR